RGTPDNNGNLQEQKPSSSGMNNFQGRYYMLHPWEGEVTCESPMRGNWGGPPSGGELPPMGAPSELSGAKRGDGQAKLPELVDEDIPWIGVKAAAASTRGGDTKTPPATLTPADGEPPPLDDGEPDVDDDRGCSSAPGAAGLGLGLLALLGLALRRR
ncbi:MAG: hypothetical protein H6741_32685, partial [Alphaproteobacteria bacterium]|nr:hypothetical protein [Alphaproteobacteria bacterium]